MSAARRVQRRMAAAYRNQRSRGAWWPTVRFVSRPSASRRSGIQRSRAGKPLKEVPWQRSRVYPGYGSGRALRVSPGRGRPTWPRPPAVVDVHWRGGPIRRMSAFEVSAALTIPVAGTPGLTISSISHQACASGGIAANNCARISDGDGVGSVMTHTNVTCPCVSHASESACLMTPTEDGA